MQPKKKVLRELEGNVHTTNVGRLNGASLPSGMFTGNTRGATPGNWSRQPLPGKIYSGNTKNQNPDLLRRADLPDNIYKMTGSMHGMTPRNQRVIDPLKRKRLDRI